MLDEIRRLIVRHAGDHQLPGLPLLRLRHATAPTAPSTAVFDRAFVLVAQGEKRATLDEQILRYGAGDFLIASIELPVLAQIVRAPPYLAFAMTLRPEVIAELASTAPPAPLGLAVGKAPPGLLDPIARMLRLLDHPEDVAVLGPMLEREILWRLLQTEQGAMLRQLGSADRGLGRAIAFIRAHFAEKLAIADAARIAGMSEATFYRHFRAMTAMSPLQYQKHIRLQDARVRLLADAHDIAAVGYAVGYDSPSQFSREYARLFGAPPGRDVERLRGEPPT